MQEIIRDLKTYLIENYGDQKDFLMLQQVVALPKPKVIAKPTVVAKPPPLKKPEPLEEPPLPPAPSFITEKHTATKTSMSEEMSSIYKKIAPRVSLVDTPLNDAVAKQIRQASTKRSDLPEIPIFADLEHFDFLTKLSEAITKNFGKSSLLSITEFEEKNLWKPLLANSPIRLIILPETLLKHSPNLLSLTKEYPGRLLRSIEKIPLLALSDLRDTPVRKKEIWALLERFFK